MISGLHTYIYKNYTRMDVFLNKLGGSPRSHTYYPRNVKQCMDAAAVI